MPVASWWREVAVNPARVADCTLAEFGGCTSRSRRRRPQRIFAAPLARAPSRRAAARSPGRPPGLVFGHVRASPPARSKPATPATGRPPICVPQGADPGLQRRVVGRRLAVGPLCAVTAWCFTSPRTRRAPRVASARRSPRAWPPRRTSFPPPPAPPPSCLSSTSQAAACSWCARARSAFAFACRGQASAPPGLPMCATWADVGGMSLGGRACCLLLTGNAGPA